MVSFRLLLLTLAAFGLIGQSTAMAMAPPAALLDASKAEAGVMDCAEMPVPKSTDSIPCKQMTLQCIAAMGCITPVVLEPKLLAYLPLPAGRNLFTRSNLLPLEGRTSVPPAEPPSVLI